jgi:hypothetical protein
VKPPSHQNTSVLSAQHTSRAVPCSAKNLCTWTAHIALQIVRNQVYVGDQPVRYASVQSRLVTTADICGNEGRCHLYGAHVVWHGGCSCGSTWLLFVKHGWLHIAMITSRLVQAQ